MKNYQVIYLNGMQCSGLFWILYVMFINTYNTSAEIEREKTTHTYTVPELKLCVELKIIILFESARLFARSPVRLLHMHIEWCRHRCRIECEYVKCFSMFGELYGQYSHFHFNL